MPYSYDCPARDCEYSAQDNEMGVVVENAQQHRQDKHGESATREDVEERIVGP
ncbi:DUF1059 domain-containing protein [Halostella salina]|uniref:DUF1059 domain-containing protein n=1 Tax=Halostella salina TaxID=1547897 RepID=UPI000EF8168E|nr:DUF1059 domain-containing protein [Halostella salina]